MKNLSSHTETNKLYKIFFFNSPKLRLTFYQAQNNSIPISFFHRLMKEGICDRSSAPSVSAISRLLRGRDGEDDRKLTDGKLKATKKKLILTKAWI